MSRGVYLSWSSGKDSAHALSVLREDPGVEVLGLLTTVTSDFDRVSMHGVRRELLMAQAERVGLPVEVVEIPAPCTDEVYAERMAAALGTLAGAGAEAIAFGDLFLEDVRDYRVERLAGTGLEPLFPLWGLDTARLARSVQSRGVRAVVTCVDPRAVPRELAGREWDAEFLDALPDGADPCGEHGEFHTFVYDAPTFRAPVPVRVGEVVERDGFVFADVLPA